MKYIMSAFVMLVLSAGLAHTQSANVQDAEILEYGLYAMDSTAAGNDSISHLHLTATTHTVPLRLRVMFGFQYRLVGAPSGAPVLIKEVVLFPPGGLRLPGKPPVPLESHEATVKIGDTLPLTWKFDNPWELVPGLWTLQVWSGDRKLVEQSFTVLAQ
jgi:hypothetical protein